MTEVLQKVANKNRAVYISSLRLLACSCGTFKESFMKPGCCPDCKTTKVVETEQLNKKGKVRVENRLETKEKDSRSFHLVKTELALIVNLEEKTCELKTAGVFELIYSMRDRKMIAKRNGKESSDVDRFFRGITDAEVLSEISTPDNQELYLFAYRNLGRVYGERNDKLSRGLVRLWDNPHIELFNFCGFSNSLISVHNSLTPMSEGKTKPNEILGVPKYMMKFLKKLNSFDRWLIRRWTDFDKALGSTNFKTVLEIIDDESDLSLVSRMQSNFLELCEEYGYRNHRQLATYLARDIKLQQGITSPVEGATLLRDYNRICKEMNISAEKYPKNLKKDHDIASMNYSVVQDVYRKEQFEAVMSTEEWEKVLYKGENYVVVKPTEPSDLVKEGDALGHCVKSYVDDVIKEKCKILFIRIKGLEDKSLLTVEIRGNLDDGFRVVQVRGQGNRQAVPKEKQFIREWAEKKELKLAY